jgi:hypothetical protein
MQIVQKLLDTFRTIAMTKIGFRMVKLRHALILIKFYSFPSLLGSPICMFWSEICTLLEVD